jgi:hypothetical protein
MSKGAGRVERAIRDMIARDEGCRRVASSRLFWTAFGAPPWTRAQRVSALRAMRRIVVGQLRWSERRETHSGRVEVVFNFDSPHGAVGVNRSGAVQYLSPRPLPKRQVEQAQRRQQRERKRLLQERREARAAEQRRPPPDPALLAAHDEQWNLLSTVTNDLAAALDRLAFDDCPPIMLERWVVALNMLGHQYEQAMRLCERRLGTALAAVASTRGGSD